MKSSSSLVTRYALLVAVFALVAVVLTAGPALAVRTGLPIITPKGPYPGTVSANDLDFVFTAADTTNLNDFTFTGREVILVQNTDAAAQTFTLTSTLDPQKRSGDIATYSLGIGEFAVFWAGNVIGWSQTGGKFHLQGSTATVKFAVIRIP